MKSILLSISFLVVICNVSSLKLGVEGKNIENCENGNVTNAKLPLPAKNSEGFALYMLCLLKENDIISRDGKIQKEVVRDKAVNGIGVGSEDVEKAVECAVQKDDEKDTAISFFNCVDPLVKKNKPSKTSTSTPPRD
ncbi:uncharacterized protein LOC123315817 [Coccinella septempunctata]|uniref:uncharacterized protein LOC123315817 n=1 Tax=Coccinella septempunctata TaxID=41139 RepID=UPI001D08586A|nr:uncharacterized protein LOC123315817 [Coccinella septempunctata]